MHQMLSLVPAIITIYSNNWLGGITPTKNSPAKNIAGEFLWYKQDHLSGGIIQRNNSTAAEQTVQAETKASATMITPNHTLRRLAALYRLRSPSNSFKSR
jgi:hypothetical protein